MAYRLDINEDFAVYRANGNLALWHRNPVYGYYAIVEVLPGKLTSRKLAEWATHAGEPVEKVFTAYEQMIRSGGNGMLPRPEFTMARL